MESFCYWGSIIMKKIIFSRPDGGVSVVNPAGGARLAFSVTLQDGSVLSDEVATMPSPIFRKIAHPIDYFLHRWPVAGAVSEWAETEDEFLARIAAKDVPA